MLNFFKNLYKKPREIVMIKKLFKYIVVLALAVPCMASDSYDANRSRENYLLKLGAVKPQEVIKKRNEENLIREFHSSIGKEEPTITLDQYDNWKTLTCNAIIAGHDNFTQLLVKHIEHNNFVQNIIHSISLFPNMKEPLIQLGEQLPVLKKYMSKDPFVQLNVDV
jgi:hypothetical protein